MDAEEKKRFEVIRIKHETEESDLRFTFYY